MSWMGFPGGGASPPTTTPPAVPLYDVDGMELVGSPALAITGTSNTKGSYAEIVAATGRTYHGLIIDLIRATDLDVYLVDIAFGEAASEEVKIPNIFAGASSSAYRSGSKLFVPLHVPSGTRLSARAQSRQSTHNVYCEIMGVWGTLDSFSTITTLGVNTADTTGIVVDPGGTVDTKGSWQEVVASLGVEAYWVGLSNSWNYNTSRTTCRWAVDLGVGAAAAEAAVWADMAFHTNTTTDSPYPNKIGMFPTHIDSGSRLSLRAECDINDATDRLLELAVHVASDIV